MVGTYTQTDGSLAIAFTEYGLWVDEKDGWWHPTEDADLIGPYDTPELAMEAYKIYCQLL